MEEHMMTQDMLEAYVHALLLRECEASTIEKYKRDILFFCQYIGWKRGIQKETVSRWKADLVQKGYAVSTINGKLAAVNSLFAFLGWQECMVKALKRQKRIFLEKEKELTKEEYLRLVKTAGAKGKERLMLVMQTICATGIRVSELRNITVEAVRSGCAEVDCKGKRRIIFLPKKLQRMLERYIRRQKLVSGPVFLTRTGNPLNRSNIWADMKKLCRMAHVEPSKVFPHNLRHLFARTFYSIEKDIAKLADLLGHSSVETTRIYIMESGKEHRKKLEKMRLVL